MSTLYRYRKDHPYRPPHWRWERARVLRELGRRAPSLGGDDRWVVRALRLQADLDAARDDVDRCLAFERAGDIGMAYDVWDQPTDAKGRPNSGRHEVEARLLARQPAKDIAARMAVPTDVIIAFERVFFNVLDRLNNPGYIAHQVIGSAIHRGSFDNDFPAILKAFSYFTESVDLVDALVTTFNGTKPTGKDVQAFLASDSRWSTVRKAALAARMLPLGDNLTKIQVMDLNRQLTADEQAAGTASDDSYQGNVQSCIANVSFLVGKLPGQSGEPSAAELRATELLAVGAGEARPDLKDMDSFRYPEAVQES